MKKFIYSFFILTIILIPSTCFAGKAWSETELEEFFKNMGYGEHDLSSFETTSTSSLNTFFHHLNDSFYNKIFIKIPESNVFCFFVTGDSTVSFSFKNGQYVLRGNYGATPTCYQFDLDNKTFYGPGSQTYVGYVPSTWKKENYTVTEEEWNSTEFKTFLFEQVCIYSDIRIENTNYIAQGGRIVNSSFGDTIYTGSISYENTTKSASITYTSGFDSSASYDLFLERYQLSESYDYGIAEYPLTTYDLASLTTNDTSFKVDISNFALSSNSVYRLCLGKNTFEDTGSNEVYLCTDWLLPNNNTLWKFPTFTRSHYFQPLSLVAYDSNYQDPVIPDNPEEGGSGDVIDSILGGIEPYFYNNLEGYYDLLTTDKLYLKIHDNNFDLIDINNYFLKLDIGKMSGDEQIHTGSVIIDSEELWIPGNYAFPVYTINLQDYFEFQNYDYFYQVCLYDNDNNLIDRTNVFWFDETLFIETNFFQDIWSLLKKIFNTIASLPSLILEGIMKIFIPEEGFLFEHFNTVNSWLDEHLGMLYFPFEFMIEFFNRIYSAEFGEPIIVIPAMQIPLFEEYGNIYDGATFNFNDFISQSEEFQNIYNLYLICADGIIIWGLARLLLRKYEEMMTDGNANHN